MDLFKNPFQIFASPCFTFLNIIIVQIHIYTLIHIHREVGSNIVQILCYCTYRYLYFEYFVLEYFFLRQLLTFTPYTCTQISVLFYFLHWKHKLVVFEKKCLKDANSVQIIPLIT